MVTFELPPDEFIPYDGPVPEGWGPRVVNTETGEIKEAEQPVPQTWRPTRENFIKVRGGGDYLGVRYRLLWMRAEHPFWTTDVEIVKLDWAEGFAIVKGMVFDESNRLIAADIKTETRKDFPDFLEKACTGALGRALAGAGYGTEGALELDEGIGANGEPRIADAPVKNGPISITPSAVPGIRQGGRSERITTAQVSEIANLTKKSSITPEKLGALLVTMGAAPNDLLTNDWPEDLAAQQTMLLSIIRAMSHDQAGRLVQTLMAVAA